MCISPRLSLQALVGGGSGRPRPWEPAFCKPGRVPRGKAGQSVPSPRMGWGPACCPCRLTQRLGSLKLESPPIPSRGPHPPSPVPTELSSSWGGTCQCAQGERGSRCLRPGRGQLQGEGGSLPAQIRAEVRSLAALGVGQHLPPGMFGERWAGGVWGAEWQRAVRIFQTRNYPGARGAQEKQPG